jgi:hypothetical protein
MRTGDPFGFVLASGRLQARLNLAAKRRDKFVGFSIIHGGAGGEVKR